MKIDHLKIIILFSFLILVGCQNPVEPKDKPKIKGPMAEEPLIIFDNHHGRKDSLIMPH